MANNAHDTGRDAIAIKPSHLAFIERVRTRPRSETTVDEAKARRALFDQLKMELRDKHSGQQVAIGIATGAHVVRRSNGEWVSGYLG